MLVDAADFLAVAVFRVVAGLRTLGLLLLVAIGSDSTPFGLTMLLLDGSMSGIITEHTFVTRKPAFVTGEVLASSTVKDLVVGSGLQFAERRLHELKGVPDRWRLYALER